MVKRSINLLAWVLILVPALVFVSGCKPGGSEDQEKKPIANSLTKTIEPPPPPSPPPPPPLPPVAWADFENAGLLYMAGQNERAWELLQRINQLKLEPEQRKQAGFLTGLTACKLKKTGQMEKYLADPGRIPSSLRGYALYFRGLAWLEAGQAEQALALFEEYLDHHAEITLINRARLARAEALFALGQKDRAFTEGRALQKTDQGDMALLVMARWHEKMNESLKARANYHQAMKSSNIREVRSEAARKYKELLYPVVDLPGQEADQLTLVRLLRTEWRLEEALALIDKLKKRGGSKGFLSNLSREKGLILYYSGRLEEALELFQKAAPGLGRSRMLARCQMRMGRWAEAAQAYLELARRYGKSKGAKDALYEAGYCHLRHNDPKKAQAVWRRIGGQYGDDELWQMGLYYFRQKKYDQAIGQFQKLIKRYSKSKLVTPATYWLARASERKGRAKEARRLYTGLSGSNDYYYRMLAEQRLGLVVREENWCDLDEFKRLFEEGKKKYYTTVVENGRELESLRAEQRLARNMEPVPLATEELNRAIDRLKQAAAAGAMDLAGLEVDNLKALLKTNRLPSARPGPKMTREERTSLAADLEKLDQKLFDLASAIKAASGQYNRFIRLQYQNYSRLMSGLDDQARDKQLARFYPLAYPGPLFAASREFHLHPALILSVMRTESNYQPDVLSVANARGLMQILPSTGQKISKRLGASLKSPDDLFLVENNIRFGAWYLRNLIDEFHGQFPLALASYNAGPFNVKRWIDQAGDITMEEFIETIPFDQTRVYVKRILGVLYQYRCLYAGGLGTPNLDRPLDRTYLDKVNF